MNTPLLALPLPQSITGAVKKKRVLLIDTSHAKRDLRAELLPKLGMDIDCAVGVAEARCWWRPAPYDLVLINREKGRGQRERFCDDLRSAKPPERLAYLVDPPGSLVDSPRQHEELAMENSDERSRSVARKATFVPIREIRLSAGAFWKLRGESQQSAPHPSLAPGRCTPWLLRHEILRDGQRNQLRHRPAWMIY